MTDTIKLINSIRKVYVEKELSINKLDALLKEKDKDVSKSTIARFFSEKSKDDYNYRYNDTIRPLAEVLLDVDTIETTDDTETQAMKSFVKYKANVIDNLEKENHELESEISVYERLEQERKQYQRSVDFLKTQIERKDQRIDRLMASCEQKDAQILELSAKINDLIEQMKACPLRKEGE